MSDPEKKIDASHAMLRQELEDALLRNSELEAHFVAADLRSTEQEMLRPNLEQHIEDLTKALKEERKKNVSLVENEVFFSRCARIANLGFAIWDEDKDKDVFVSDELASIHGFSKDHYVKEMTSMEKYVSHIHTEDRESYLEHMTGLTDGSDNGGVDYRFLAPDGTTRHLRDLSKYLDAPFGEPGHSTVIVQDVTGEKATAQRLALAAALVEREELLTQSARMAHLGHAVWDEVNLEYISISEEYAALHGYSKEVYLETFDSIEKGLETIHPDDRERYWYHSDGPEETDDANLIEYRIVKPNGEVRYVRECYQSIHDANGQPIQSVITLQDITDHKEIEQSLEEARHRAENANRTKSEFLAMMSHEIRTPLNGVIGMAEVIKSTDLDSKQLSMACVIEDSGRDLLSILNNILDLSKLEAGFSELYEGVTDINDLATDIVKAMVPSLNSRPIVLNSLIGAEVPKQIRCDSGKLRQILVNFVGNAIKFTSQGSITVSVSMMEIDVEQEDWVCFSVKDTGIGIAKEDHGKLFSRFVQADSSISRKYGGTGLGLAISMELANLMEGKIGFDSVPGRGSNFWIALPPTVLQLNLPQDVTSAS